ncbi:MAG: hypothetical protein ACYS26_15145, partial [Planctomycetota bacterium]
SSPHSPRAAAHTTPMQRLTLAGALLAPSLLAFAPSQAPLAVEAVRFAPAEGLSLTKTYTITSESELEDQETLVNGEAPPADMDMEMTNVSTMSMTVTDTYVGVGEGRPTKLARTFDSLGSDATTEMVVPMMGPQEMEVTSSSELEEQTVHFVWDAEAGEYAVRFPEDAEDADEALLEGLTEDLDFRAFLPDGEVSEGDSWEVSPSALMDVMAPGGDLKLEAESDDEMGMGPDAGQQMSDLLGEIEGELSAQLTGFREADGVRMAVIALTFDVTSSNDLTDMIMEAMAEQEAPMGMDMDIESVDVSVAMEGEGELVWNLSAGHFSALTLEAEITTDTDMAMSMAMGTESMSLEQSMTNSGTITIEASAE